MVSDGIGVGGELMWCYRDLDHMIGMIGLVVARDGENMQRQREVRRRRRRRQRPAAAAKAAAKAAAGPRWQPRCRARHHRRRGEQGRRKRYDWSTGTGHARAQQGTRVVRRCLARRVSRSHQARAACAWRRAERNRCGPTSIHSLVHSRGHAERPAFWRPLTWELPHSRAPVFGLGVFVCALLGVSPRDRGLLPLANVNMNTHK
jgi:hypothetical protein